MHLEMDLQPLRSSGQGENIRQLKKILEDNKDTKFGRKYHFDRIETPEQYRQTVPISRYADYEEDIRKMRAGEQNILTAYPLAGFAVTSATFGTTKWVPFTKEAEQRLGRIHLIQDALLRQIPGKSLMISRFCLDLEKKEPQDGFMSAFLYRYLFRAGIISPKRYAGGMESIFGSEELNLSDQLYAKLWIAFLTPDLVMMEGIFRYEVLKFFGFMERHWAEILSDIENRNVSRQLPKSLKESLCALSAPPDRIVQIRQECEKGFDGIAKRLWPDLVLFGGVASSSMDMEEHLIRKYTEEIPWTYWVYGASEGIVGITVKPDDFSYLVLPETGFVELLPVEDNPENITILPKQAVPGQLYEIVLTSFSGLYRYAMGDVLMVKDMIGEYPLLHFCYRIGYMLNTAGEKVTNEHLKQAVQAVSRRFGISVTDYHGAINSDSSRYRIVMSVKGDLQGIDPDQVSKVLDNELMEQNFDYRDLRQKGYFRKAEGMLLREEDFHSFEAEHRWSRGNGKSKNLVMEGFEENIWKKWKEQ